MRYFVFAAISLALPACSGGERQQSIAGGSLPSMSALVLTEEAASTPATAHVGQIIEVKLNGDRPKTAWELATIVGERIEELKKGAYPEVTQAPDQADPTVGQYLFRFRCLAPGDAILHFDYLYPAGSGERRRTEIVRSVEFAITIEKGSDGPSEKAN